MHINECITDYIVWVDFFGIFIAVILESGELKIIAVSLTN